MLQQDAEQLFRVAIDLAPAGMLAVDSDGVLVLVNREVERMFGYGRHELVGQSVEMLVPDAVRGAHPGYRRGYHAAARTRPMGGGQGLRGLRKDGSEVPVEIGLNPVELHGETLVLASVVDISARLRVEEELRQRQKLEAIGTLAGGIAHDFNNILLGIVGYTELAADTMGPGEVQEDLQAVLRAAGRGRELVQRILSFSRRSEIQRRPVQPGPAVAEVLGLLRASLSKRVELRTTIEPDAPRVLSEPGMLNQIVMNLVTNAAQAMPEGGPIEVSVGAWHLTEGAAPPSPGMLPGGYTRLRVRDHGCGMDEAELQRVLEPFFTTKPQGEGTGLGMSTTHRLVQDHAGGLRLDSTPGVGTTVDVYLPAYHGERRSQQPAGAQKVHALLVEDELELAVMLRRQLERFGMMVTVCTSSEDALEAFRDGPTAIDILITDNNMPGMTGLQLTAELLAERPELPVLLISGLAETLEPGAAEALGIGRVLSKPHSSAELREAVKSLLMDP